MKQLIKMSLVVFGVLCGSADCVSTGIDVGIQLSDLKRNNVLCNPGAPLVHQYYLENLPGGAIIPVASIQVDLNSLPRGIKGIQAILASGNWNEANPNEIVSGVGTPELWITVLSRSSVQSNNNEDNKILFRPQWAFADEWQGGKKDVSGDPTSYTCTFSGGSTAFRDYSGSLLLHGTNLISPNCHPLPDIVQNNNSSFAVAYHTTYTSHPRNYTKSKDIYGVIVVCDENDLNKFNKAVNDGCVLVDALRQISIVNSSALAELVF